VIEWEVEGRRFLIRTVDSETDYHAIEDLQKEVWGFSDLDVVPMANMVAAHHAGGVVLGAFEADQMIGFAYAFPAIEKGRALLHSHMLAVKTDVRNLQVGFQLKLAQRAVALEHGFDEITWTFDPLQSLNAHLNFSKLGVVSSKYIVNFYGEETSSPLHKGFGTDRLWVRWQLNSERVVSRMVSRQEAQRPTVDPNATRLVRLVGDYPQPGDFTRIPPGQCLIEIPRDINLLKLRDPAAGRAWREATRKAFLSAIDHGYLVQDFAATDPDYQNPFYSLRQL
jgi:predicted GNAT superfamily acetyltransferase